MANIKAIYLLAISFLIVCSPKLRYPLEEIKRPISLPQKNWGVSIGVGPGYYHTPDTSFLFLSGKGNIPFGYLLPIFAYPYLLLKDHKTELHFTPLHLKLYPVRNVIVEDSTLCINGPNLAIGGGITGFGSSYYNGELENISVSLDIFSEFKAPISKKKWVYSKLLFFFTPNSNQNYENGIDIDVNIGLGIQFNKKLYSTFGLLGLYGKKTIVNKDPLGFLMKDYFEYYEMSLPLQLGYNFNKRWKIFIFTDAGYGSKDSYFVGSGLGFDFYW